MWATASAVTVTFSILAVLIFVVMVNGLGYFWLNRIALLELKDGSRTMGEILRYEQVPDGSGRRLQLKIGNRDLYGLDFRWVKESDVTAITYPHDAAMLERQEFGNFYGFLRGVHTPEDAAQNPVAEWENLRSVMASVENQQADQV